MPAQYDIGQQAEALRAALRNVVMIIRPMSSAALSHYLGGSPCFKWRRGSLHDFEQMMFNYKII